MFYLLFNNTENNIAYLIFINLHIYTIIKAKLKLKLSMQTFNHLEGTSQQIYVMYPLKQPTLLFSTNELSEKPVLHLPSEQTSLEKEKTIKIVIPYENYLKLLQMTNSREDPCKNQKDEGSSTSVNEHEQKQFVEGDICRKKITSFVQDYQRELIMQVVQFISSSSQNFTYQAAVQNLYQAFFYKQEIPSNNRLKQNNEVVQCLPQESGKEKIIDKRKLELEDYNYLHYQLLPQYYDLPVDPYGHNNSHFYDMVAIRSEEQTREDELKVMEQRLAAQIFCSKGYGINYFRQAITDTSFILSKERYKSLLGTTIRLGFRNIQHFLLYKMKRNISALKRMEVKALLTPLLNIQKQFSSKYRDTFHKCLRTSFKLKTEPALDVDVLQFYKALVAKTRGAAFAKIVDEKLTIEEERRVNSRFFEETKLWTPDMQREFAMLYMRKRCLSGIKQEFERKYPNIDSEHFVTSRLRARSDRIFASAAKRLNLLLDRSGKQELMLNMTDKLKKMLSRSPIGAEIRIKLCQLYLRQDIELQFVIETVNQIHLLITENNGLLQNSSQTSEGLRLRPNKAKKRESEVIRRGRRSYKYCLRSELPSQIKMEESSSFFLDQSKLDNSDILQSDFSSFQENEGKAQQYNLKIEQKNMEDQADIFYSEDEDHKAANFAQVKRCEVKREAESEEEEFLDEIDRLIAVQSEYLKTSKKIN